MTCWWICRGKFRNAWVTHFCMYGGGAKSLRLTLWRYKIPKITLILKNSQVFNNGQLSDAFLQLKLHIIQFHLSCIMTRFYRAFACKSILMDPPLTLSWGEGGGKNTCTPLFHQISKDWSKINLKFSGSPILAPRKITPNFYFRILFYYKIGDVYKKLDLQRFYVKFFFENSLNFHKAIKSCDRCGLVMWSPHFLLIPL